MIANLFSGGIRTKNISQIIINRIITSLGSGELKPGDRLPTEDEFATRLGVSKSSVREAVKILEAFGILEIRRADGTYIADSFRENMLDPVVFSLLLNEHDAWAMLEFKVRILLMALDELIDRRVPSETIAAATVEALAGDDPARGELLPDMLARVELALAACIDNALIRALVTRSVQIAAYKEEQVAAMLQAAGSPAEAHTAAKRFLAALEEGRLEEARDHLAAYDRVLAEASPYEAT